MVGGLLISYRLEGELKGASSTKSGMASGCEGLVMEPCTGATLYALGRLEGDEVLASRVFSIADSERVAGGARAAWAQMGVLWKGALAWLLFHTKRKFSQGKRSV